jgi:hypothetical protein
MVLPSSETVRPPDSRRRSRLVRSGRVSTDIWMLMAGPIPRPRGRPQAGPATGPDLPATGRGVPSGHTALFRRGEDVLDVLAGERLQYYPMHRSSSAETAARLSGGPARLVSHKWARGRVRRRLAILFCSRVSAGTRLVSGGVRWHHIIDVIESGRAQQRGCRHCRPSHPRCLCAGARWLAMSPPSRNRAQSHRRCDACSPSARAERYPGAEPERPDG